MKINNRPSKTITKHGYDYKVVKLSRIERQGRFDNNIPLPCFEGNEGWALMSIIENILHV